MDGLIFPHGPFFVQTAISSIKKYCLSPCQTRRRSRGVCEAFLNFLISSRTPRELQEKIILFVKKQVMLSSRRPRRVQCVPTELSLRSAEFYVAFHGPCTTFSHRLRGALGVRTALPRRSHRASTAFAPRFHGVLALP